MRLTRRRVYKKNIKLLTVMNRLIVFLSLLRKARTGRNRQGFLLIELVMALFLFVLMVGVASRLIVDLVRMSTAQMTRCTLLRLAQTGAECSGDQRSRLADANRGVMQLVFNTQRTGQGAARTYVRATQGKKQTVQLTVVDV